MRLKHGKRQTNATKTTVFRYAEYGLRANSRRLRVLEEGYSCECPDHQNGNFCKHILLLETFLSLKNEAKGQRADAFLIPALIVLLWL